MSRSRSRSRRMRRMRRRRTELKSIPATQYLAYIIHVF
jgi:hypothetical protein